MKKSTLRFFENFFVVAFLAAYMGTFTRIFVSRINSVAVVNENNFYSQIFFALSYLFALLYFSKNLGKLKFAIRKMPVIWFLVAWASISIIWSYSPDITFRRSIALVGTTLFAAYLASRYSINQTVHFLGIAFVFLVIASYFFSITGNNALGWTGVFLTKNELARASFLAAVVFGYLLFTTRNKLWGIFLLGALGLMYKSNSATVDLLFFVTIFLIWSYTTTRKLGAIKRTQIISMVGLLTIFLAIILFLNLKQVLTFFQRNATITGRIPLWVEVLKAVAQKPLLGYGYGAFWTGWSGPSAKIWAIITWLPPSAHNGYLDISLDLGLIGGILYLLFIFSFIRRALRKKQMPDAFTLFMLIFTAFLLIYNLVENISLSRNSIIWLMGVMIFLQSIPVRQRQMGNEKQI